MRPRRRPWAWALGAVAALAAPARGDEAKDADGLTEEDREIVRELELYEEMEAVRSAELLGLLPVLEDGEEDDEEKSN